MGSALTQIAAQATSRLLMQQNAARLGALFYNDSSANLYLGLTGSTVSTSIFTIKIPPAGYYELPYVGMYCGPISGIWDAASGNVRITELF